MSKHLNHLLNQVLKCAVNVINFVKAHALKARFLKKLCDMGAEHSSCCTTAMHDGSPIVMFYHLPLKRGRKFLFSLRKKHVKIPQDFANADF